MHAPYPNLAVNLLISTVIMHFVMFTMIDGLEIDQMNSIVTRY